MKKTVSKKQAKGKEELHTLLIRLPVNTYERLGALSYKKRIPIAAICREAINKHIENEKIKES